MRRFWRERAGERGQALVLMAMVMSGLVMMVGLAVDAGQLYVARRTMQEAADSAAYGGAVVLYMGGTVLEARNAAIADATKNGFTTGGDVVVTVNSPPLGGAYVGNPAYVEVIIRNQVRTAMIPAQGLSLVEVRGVAGTTPASSGHAIKTLKPTGNDAFKVSGNGNMTVVGGGIFVNSNDANSAAHISGSGNVTATYTMVVGGYHDSGPGNFTPAPTTGAAPESDTFSGIPTPSTGGLINYGFRSISSDTTTYLDPGIYDGIQISGNGDVYLRPGLYVLRDKGLQVSGNGSLLMDPASPIDQGLMFFNTKSNYPATGGSCDKLQFSGNGVIALRAMSAAQSPTYKGMVVFQDRTCDKDFQVSGNATWTATGTIYLPIASFQSSGNGTINSIAGQLVAQTVQVSGDAAFTMTYNAGLTAAPLIPALSE